MTDPVSGVVLVGAYGKRLTREEVLQVRELMAQGVPLQFQDRHQWRHFQRYSW